MGVKVIDWVDEDNDQVIAKGGTDEWAALEYNGLTLIRVPVAARYWLHAQTWCVLPNALSGRPPGRAFRVLRHEPGKPPNQTALDRISVDMTVRSQAWLYSVEMFMEPDVPLTFEFSRKLPASLTLTTRILRVLL